MKGKGSRLAILLALVLTLVGAFSVTAFAETDHVWKTSPNGNTMKVWCKAEGHEPIRLDRNLPDCYHRRGSIWRHGDFKWF